jgi:integrase
MALQLAAPLFVRPGEIRHARWGSSIQGKPVWNIPAEVMNMDRPHRVTLARQAAAIMRHLKTIIGKGELCFRRSRRCDDR